MVRVYIAEKPSVARNIAQAIGASVRRNGYFEGNQALVTWAFGHLLELYDVKDYNPDLSSWRMENFPFIPETFLYKVKKDSSSKDSVDEGAKLQLEIIQSLINREEVTHIVSACDYDREGQIIGDILLEYLNVKKPVERLLLNEWTPEEVNEGIKKLVSNETMKPLRDAGISRQWADWLIGINLTSVATLKYQRGSGKALNIGRVLMPTLKIIYDRDREIEQFIPEEYHRLLVNVKTVSNELFDMVYQVEDQERFDDFKQLEQVKVLVSNSSGFILDVQEEVKREYPPSLFNLTGLQGYITSKHKGWSSDKVLKVAQALYEKKLITYPRTASLALEESLISKAKRVLEVHKKGLAYEKDIIFHTNKRVFDNSKVESHSAIIPTYLVAKDLSSDEANVYHAVVNRFVMQFMPIAEHREITISAQSNALVDLDEHRGHFIAKGRIQLVEGWRIVEGIKSKEKSLPPLIKGDSVTFDKCKIETKGTSPPKRHTEKTLLRIMETCGRKSKGVIKKSESEEESVHDDLDLEGIDVTAEETREDKETIQAILSGYSIGTPATRAETISKLLRVGYIATKGKSLYCTEVGRKMVELFPIKSLFDLDYTGRLEKMLSDIGKNLLSLDSFIEDMKTFTKDAVLNIKQDDFHVIQAIENSKKVTDLEVLGRCPSCGSDIVETDKGYGCTNWKSGCKYTIWKNDKFLAALQVTPNAQTIKKLLAVGEVCSHRFVNKKGENFSACLQYLKDEGSGYYKWHMRFPSQ
jgi:DNA topoisomerase-3